jgi:hypothetical protein
MFEKHRPISEVFNDIIDILDNQKSDEDLKAFYEDSCKFLADRDVEEHISERDRAIALMTIALFMLHNCEEEDDEPSLISIGVTREVGNHFLTQRKLVNMFNTGTVQ